MYDAIKFFGSCKELLAFTRSLRAAELLDAEYDKNVHAKHNWFSDYHIPQSQND